MGDIQSRESSPISAVDSIRLGCPNSKHRLIPRRSRGLSGRESFVELVHIEIAPPGPCFMLFDQERPEETASRFDAGEDPNHPLPSTNLFVQTLRHVGRGLPLE